MYNETLVGVSNTTPKNLVLAKQVVWRPHNKNRVLSSVDEQIYFCFEKIAQIIIFVTLMDSIIICKKKRK